MRIYLDALIIFISVAAEDDAIENLKYHVFENISLNYLRYFSHVLFSAILLDQ